MAPAGSGLPSYVTAPETIARLGSSGLLEPQPMQKPVDPEIKMMARQSPERLILAEFRWITIIFIIEIA